MLKKCRKGKEADPEQVQIYPTNRCNLKCIFCAQVEEDYGYDDELSKEKWLEVTRELVDMNIDEILISGGGEPFCVSSTILEMMQLIKTHDIDGRIITNGTLLDSIAIDKMIDVGWDVCVISLDGSYSKTHDSLRGRDGTFSKILENIKRINSIKSNLPKIEINFVLNKRNYTEIPEMILLCDKLGIDSINFEPITMNNPYGRELKLNKRRKKELIEQIIPKAKQIFECNDYPKHTNLEMLSGIEFEKAGEMKEIINRRVDVNSVIEDDDFINSACFEPWLWPKIEANGDVWPCSTTPLNVNVKDKSFKEIWYGENFERFRDRIIRHDLPEQCENCVTTHVDINDKIRKELSK